MKRKIITNLAFLLFLNLIVKTVYAFGIDIHVQNTVGAANYGNYFIILNLCLIFQIILDLGIENFSRREIARDLNLLDNYLSNIIPLKILLGIAYFLICSIIGYFMEWRNGDFILLLLLLFNQFLAGLILYFRANIGGLHMFKADSMLSVIDKVIVIIICGLLLLNSSTRLSFKIEWLVYSQTAAYIISSAIALYIVFLKTHKINFRFDLTFYRNILLRSLPFALLILLMSTYMRVDSVLIGKLLINGKEQAGIYAQSFRIIEILSNFGYLFSVILLPAFSRMIRLGEPVAGLTRLASILLIIPAITIAVGCISFRVEIIDLLYPATEKSVNVFGILTFSFLGMCITYIFGTLLTANGNMRQLNFMAIMAIAINLILNLILIRKYGIVGAATASAVTQIFTGVYQISLSKKIFRFNIDHILILKITLFIIITVSGAYFLRSLPLYWVYSFIIYLFFALILSFILRLMSLKAIFKFILHQN